MEIISAEKKKKSKGVEVFLATKLEKKRR